MKKYLYQIALIAAISAILLFLLQVVYIGGTVYFIVLGILSFAIFISIPIYVLRQYRKANGGILTFQNAFLASFGGLMLGSLISSAFQLTYTSAIDPEFPARIASKTVEMTYGFMEGQIPEEQAEELLRKTEKDALDRYTPAGVLKSLGIWALIVAVLSLIIAAVMKRNPQFRTDSTILDS